MLYNIKFNCYVAKFLLCNKTLCYIAHPNLPDGRHSDCRPMQFKTHFKQNLSRGTPMPSTSDRSPSPAIAPLHLRPLNSTSDRSRPP